MLLNFKGKLFLDCIFVVEHEKEVKAKIKIKILLT
tara:strand:+ start:255 stop:359 length:105 start_codon:yes stop_codon:yes gene_type:complete